MIEYHNNTFFNDPLILSNICEYLTIPDRLALASTNQSIRFVMNQLFKGFISDNQLTIIEGKTPIRQMKFYFDRCLRIYKFQNHLLNLQTTIQIPFKFQVIKYFEVGVNFSVCLDNHKQAYIFKTNLLLNNYKEKPIWLCINDVKLIHCKGQKLVVLKQDGSVQMFSGDRFSKNIIEDKQIIKWTFHIPVENIFVSYNYVIFFPKPTHRTFILSQVFQMQVVQQQQQQPNQYLIAYNLQTKKYLLLRPNFNDKIITCAVGIKQAYFISQSHKCYHCQFDEVNEGAYEIGIRIFQGLKDKNIVKIASGYNFFIALETNLQKIQDWDNDRTIKWLKQIGFQSYSKIAKIEKLDEKIYGKCIRNHKAQYATEIYNEYLLAFRKQASSLPTVWMGEKTNVGNLHLPQLTMYHPLLCQIVHPQKIKMPHLKQTQYIDSIFCGWYQTFIRTQKGRIHHTIWTMEKKKDRQKQSHNNIKKPHRKTSKESDDDPIETNQFSQHSEQDKQIQKIQQNRFKYKKRKKTQQAREKVKKDKKHSQEEKWVESSEGKAFFVQSFKDNVFMIQCPSQTHFQPDRQKKLRTAKSVLDKILWDESLNKQQFKVGYMDKEMGVIELSLVEIQMFEVKENRIVYFKKNNNIVWDRINKFDNLY